MNLIENSFTTEDIAKRYEVKVATVTGWRAKRSKFKGPPHINIGNKIFYPKASTEEWELKQLSIKESNG